MLRAGPPAQQGLAVSVFLHTEHANITVPNPAFFHEDQCYGKDLMIWISDHPDIEFVRRRNKCVKLMKPLWSLYIHAVTEPWENSHELRTAAFASLYLTRLFIFISSTQE